jgi:hypothetical protein
MTMQNTFYSFVDMLGCGYGYLVGEKPMATVLTRDAGCGCGTMFLPLMVGQTSFGLGSEGSSIH